MKFEGLEARDVVGAREEIFNIIQRNPTRNIIYFDGWNGFGAIAVLRSIAQTLPSMKGPPPELDFGRIFLIDCSTWQSKRVMQRKIVEELKLDRKAMAMIDEQDEEDDFNGVDYGSRDVIREVSTMIAQTLIESRFMMIFLNGSNDEVDLSEFGIPEYTGLIIWTFRRSFVTMHETDGIFRLADKLRRTILFIRSRAKPTYLSDSELNALFSKEAANDIVARYPFLSKINLTMVIDCCFYGFFLHRISRSTIMTDWAPHAPNFWICDGIIQEGDRTREISNALGSEIGFGGDDSLLDEVFDRMMQCLRTYYLVVKGEDDDKIDKYEERPYRWIFVTSKKKIVQDNMKNILARATSIFLAFSRTIGTPSLPNALFKQCSKVRVLILSCCAFSFESPPFLHCHTLRFLGLYHCTDDDATEPQGGVCTTKCAFLKSLWAITLYYTDWAEILSKEHLELMENLMELDIEGVRWSQWTGHQLQKRLSCLQRLRIIRSMFDKAETSSGDLRDTFLMDNTNLEMLDLSGCDALEDVVLSNNYRLRSFSLVSYGPTSHLTSSFEVSPETSHPEQPPDVQRKRSAKTTIVSLKGCTRLDKLLLHGLPNLVELDLSGCPIKVLDFETMMVDVPRLKRLFLLGCERLRAIKWGSNPWKQWKVLELLCIDTRPAGRVLGCAAQPSLGTFSRSFHLQVHAIIVDARLARSLVDMVIYKWTDGVCFSINITSLTACSGAVVQPEATASKMTETIDKNHHVAVGLYGDIFTEVGDDLIPMQAFPQPPTRQSDHHIEIGDGSRNVQTEIQEVSDNDLAWLMTRHTESIHVHDVSTCSSTMPAGRWHKLKWCRVQRCPNLHAVFPPGTEDYNGSLETIWVSDLLMARCIWSKRNRDRYSGDGFRGLQHLHLRSCPSLQFALPMGNRSSFPSLETLHIIHCGDIRHIFVPGLEEYQHTSVQFPKLTTIHLHDLPALQQICEAAKTLAPALETIRIRGCWSLRRFPSLKGRKPGVRGPAVEVEKDVWDKLEWDGLGAGHHPSLYETPVHSRYYKQSRLLRGTVLR
ncbi:unnamed protein product [Urochloa decumbens]|uniref:Disease resistance protein At4g27190-like leucine-rich repeats domain-containing protein n=1 Tax=Urochloa decumbens TaxID=240449 RepID=A0ABC9H8Q9_9POAL